MLQALGVYTDSSKSAYDDAKFETIFEMGRRVGNMQVSFKV